MAEPDGNHSLGEVHVEVLVLRGGGDRAFVSGGDLKELSAIRTQRRGRRRRVAGARAPDGGTGPGHDPRRMRS